MEEQTALFSGSDDVTGVVIPDTGHALTLHYTAEEFSAEVDDWLNEHDFSGPALNG